MSREPRRLTARLFLMGLLITVSAPSEEPALRGFSAAASKVEREWEQKFRALPDPARLREYMRVITQEPHHAGSPGSKKVAGYILGKFREWGLPADLEEFHALLPTPKERAVELLAPEKFRAELREPPVPADPDSTDADQLPTYNAYSADGDVTGQLVYVNYGVPEDYEQLKKLGVEVKGKIVIARYGQSWRGIKPKVAYEHGAVGCLIYSDPRDDGYFRGDVFPEGAYRPSQGVQRGSVMDMPIHPGDPLTPGWGAVKDARRLALGEARTLQKIPVLPISYGDATPLLRNLRGPVAPEAWRGALPLTYHVGPGPAVARLKAAFDWSVRPIYDVIARIPGSQFPDEWIIYGNHHDAWVNGAADPTSANAALMETARGLGELLKQGWKPRRTLILASWDAEEWGLIGSTEWAEQHAGELSQKAVVYINSDSNGKGVLNSAGSHSLEKFVNELARDVSDPVSGKSVWQALKDRRLEQATTPQTRADPERAELDKKDLAERADLRIAALGSGSDYTPFLQHLAVSSLNLGFGGEGAFGGVYHSIYDSFYWYTHFSDTTFVYGRALAQTIGTALLRLAGAEVLPFEFTNLADTLERYAGEVEKLFQKEKGGEGAAGQKAEKDVALDFAPLRAGVEAVKKSAAAYQAAFRDARLEGDPRELNRILYQTERAMAASQGLPRRGWYQHQLYAPGAYTGYAVKTLPGVREAIEAKQWAEARAQMLILRDALLAVARQVDAATRKLK